MLTVATAAMAQAEPDLQGVTKPNGYTVSVYSQLQPININQIHSWVIRIRNPKGVPIDDAKVSVDGGMPEHDHGLPTTPKVTRQLGNGEYLLEGLKFHMHGWWQISFSISISGVKDSVVIDLNL